MRNEDLDYWGDLFTRLDERYQLIAKHQLGFIGFYASMSLNPRNYSKMIIYLDNPDFARSGLTLLDFLRSPDAHVLQFLQQLPAINLRFFPLLKVQERAATYHLFCMPIHSDFWEQRLERGTLDCHGGQLVKKTIRHVGGFIHRYSYQRRGHTAWQPKKS